MILALKVYIKNTHSKILIFFLKYAINESKSYIIPVGGMDKRD